MMPSGLFQLPPWIIFTDRRVWAVIVLGVVVGVPAMMDRFLR